MSGRTGTIVEGIEHGKACAYAEDVVILGERHVERGSRTNDLDAEGLQSDVVQLVNLALHCWTTTSLCQGDSAG
jgi:hypothetical protein